MKYVSKNGARRDQKHVFLPQIRFSLGRSNDCDIREVTISFHLGICDLFVFSFFNLVEIYFSEKIDRVMLD